MGRRFAGKLVVITGAAGAIGAAAARRFADEGAKIAAIDRADAAELIEDLARRGTEARAFIADVGDERAVSDAMEGIVARLGPIDVLFNNAGIAGRAAPVHQLAVADWDEVIRINLRGIFLVQRAVLADMIARQTQGAIVNMGSSMAGWDVLSGGAAYVASKHAVVGLTQATAREVAGHGVRVNAICPGVVETRLGVPAADEAAYRESLQRFAARIPLGRLGAPEDVAAAVAFLASDEARHVTGAAWLIDGGQTLQSWANAP